MLKITKYKITVTFTKNRKIHNAQQTKKNSHLIHTRSNTPRLCTWFSCCNCNHTSNFSYTSFIRPWPRVQNIHGVEDLFKVACLEGPALIEGPKTKSRYRNCCLNRAYLLSVSGLSIVPTKNIVYIRLAHFLMID